MRASVLLLCVCAVLCAIVSSLPSSVVARPLPLRLRPGSDSIPSVVVASDPSPSVFWFNVTFFQDEQCTPEPSSDQEFSWNNNTCSSLPYPIPGFRGQQSFLFAVDPEAGTFQFAMMDMYCTPSSAQYQIEGKLGGCYINDAVSYPFAVTL